MIVDSTEELKVNFAYAIHFPEDGSYMYPFGTNDEQILHHTSITIGGKHYS